MTARRWFVSCAAVAVLVAPLFWGAPNGASEIAPSPDTRKIASPSPSLAGTPSCSARGCHGAVDPVASRPLPDCPGKIDPASLPVVRQNEFSLWLARDKHAQAYQVLDGDLGGRILKNLYGADKAKWDESACLACHTNPLAAIGESTLLKQERLSGVGCESCHGAASKWLDDHTKPEWMCKTRDEKAAYGMKPVGDPVPLAQTCVGCHVGAPAADGAPVRDMNHDMIAAGHPRLDFELSAFLANMPPHWEEKDQAKKQGPAYPARLWAVGQIATAQAALALLADRAADTHRPWPEFSEYNCYACHHDLTDPSWRQKRGYGKRPPGSLPWGTWYSVMPCWLEGSLLLDETTDPGIADGFDELETAMATPQKARGELPAMAKRLTARLTPLLTKMNKAEWGTGKAQRLLHSLENLGPNDSPSDWDAAEQLYLAAAALSQDQGAERSQEKLSGLVKMLAQPRAYRPEEFLKSFQPALKNLVEKQ
jgi:Cytochrome c554 and c-prime